MWKLGLGLICLSGMFFGCASGGSQAAGESVGTVLRAPVDLFAGIGRGISGKKFTPGREFQQNWQTEESEHLFWEPKDLFFTSL